MIARAALQARAAEWGLTEEVVEKDYVLGWLLWGIGSHPSLSEGWIFKGGTCLKKCFVETYRFSEDLDFTVLEGTPLAPDDVRPVLAEALDAIEQESGLSLTGREPIVRLRPDGRSAEGRIYYRGPRALGQRTRPRDLYDVVNLHRRLDLRTERDLVAAILHEKCAFKQVAVPTLEAVTEEAKARELRADWNAMLAHQLPALPPVDEFLTALDGVFAWLSGEEDPTPLASIPAGHEKLDATWIVPSTLTRWPDGAPLEQIRFAGANHLLVELGYNGTTRPIEPYALRRSQAGNLLVYAIKPVTREVRAYRIDRIEGVRVTDTPFIPQYAIELSSATPVRTGLRRRGSRHRTHV